MTYQKISGTLSANAHGSYSTQDALGDLLVTDVLRQDKPSVGRLADKLNPDGEQRRGGQRMPDKDNFNAVITPDKERTEMDNNSEYVVRRLTPEECELLQGFPLGWTSIPGASDTARYKALGNSIALPQWQIIIDNMAKYLPDGATLGSLFDGISGFCLCWERTHGKGTAKWASEIEAFPIKVTKYHFGCEEDHIEGDIEKYLDKPIF